jgi:hypothetical protein
MMIQALAARTADYVLAQGADAFTRRATLTAPAVRYDLSPPDTFGSGVPRRRGPPTR